MENQNNAHLLNSTELIELARKRYSEMKHKQYDWRSFYNGFLEGYLSAVAKKV